MAVLLLAAFLSAVAAPTMFAPAVAHAAVADVDEYRDRISSARGILEGYLEVGGEESPGPLVRDLLRLVPVTGRVAVGRTEVVTDHSTFRTLLARLDVARDPGVREEVAGEMVAHLVSIERSLPGDGPFVPEDLDALESLLDESRLSSRSPLNELLGELIDRLALAFERWQAAFTAADAPRRVMAIALGVVVAALGALLVWVLVRLVLRLRQVTAGRERASVPHAASAPVVAAAEALPADVLAYAESLAAAGRFAEAVRALFGGAARSLVEAGLLTRTRTRTNAELLGEVRTGTPVVAVPLGELSSAFEYAVYGHRDPGADGYARARGDYDAVMVEIGRPGGEGA